MMGHSHATDASWYQLYHSRHPCDFAVLLQSALRVPHSVSALLAWLARRADQVSFH